MSDFRDHYQSFAGQVLAFLKARSPRGIDASDMAQETWLRAWRAWNRFEGEHRRAWLLTIARNCLTDAIRRLSRSGVSSLEMDVIAPEPADVSDEVLAMRDCLKSTDSDFAAVLRARIYEGRSVEDIARDLGIAPATVYTRVNRGKAQIADCVKNRLQKRDQL